MKVTGWTDFEDARYEDISNMPQEEFQKAFEIVKKELKDNGYKFCGWRHQYGYCPIIDNKWLFGVSLRMWGRIMQEAYDLPNKDGMGYCTWAWNTPEGEQEVLPKK